MHFGLPGDRLYQLAQARPHSVLHLLVMMYCARAFDVYVCLECSVYLYYRCVGPISQALHSLALYPGCVEGERRLGIDCLRMRDHSQKKLGIHLRLEIVGKINIRYISVSLKARVHNNKSVQLPYGFYLHYSEDTDS